MIQISQLEIFNIDYFHQFTKGSGVKIAILDSEINLEHREFEGINIKYKELVPSENPNHHGTAITSLVAGNSLGVAPKAEILHLKILSDIYGSGYAWSNAIDYALNNGADIVSMSIGSKADLSPGMRQVLQRAKEAGITFTAPSGNEGVSFVRSPANDERVIAVGGINNDKSIARMTNNSVDIEAYALSTDLLIANNSDEMPYKKISGTSFANAIVAGQLALILSYARSKGKEIKVRDFLEYYNLHAREQRKVLDMKIVKELLDSYLDLWYNIKEGMWSNKMAREKNTPQNYLLRMFRENGEVVEMMTTAPDDKIALDSANKGYGREFAIIDDGVGVKIIEEVRDE